MDLFVRKDKYSHACFGSIIPACQNLTQVGVIIANFSPSKESRPSLLTHQEVTTFFHEFGHALHDCLGRTPYYLASGTRVKTDFVEMPSQLLEEWAWEPMVLKEISSHYQTGEPLSDDLIGRLV